MIKGLNRTQARQMARQAVELYLQSTVKDVFGKPIDQYELMGVVPASIREINGYRALQYQQLGIVGVMEVRIRKPNFNFDTMFVHPANRPTEVGATFTRGDLDGLQEITIHSVPDIDMIMIGDEMVITARRKDGK